MIVLVTDFGVEGPYLGQMKAVLYQQAPGVPVLDLFSDVPGFDVQGAAYLLAAYVRGFSEGTVFLCVVDPGVGGERAAVMLEVDGCWFVGPDNGLFNVLAARATHVRWWDISWRPDTLSSSFHGRDLFAPVAAARAMGEMCSVEQCDPVERIVPGWPEELARVVYVDHYGNVITGVRASAVAQDSVIRVAGHSIENARTFSDVSPGQPFWYENSSGLLEIAVNQGRADQLLGLSVGDEVML
jgi:S-adenosylmethionine hydrolase